MRYIQSFNTSGAVQDAIESEVLGKPYIAYIEDEHRIDWNTLKPIPPEPVYSAMPLTFEIQEGGEIYWVKYGTGFTEQSIDYSINDGPWTTITSTTAPGTPISVNDGDIVRFRGQNEQYTSGTSNNTFQGSTASFNVYGNIMSMIYGDNFTGQTEFPVGPAAANFGNFFRNTKVVSAEHLVLPATALTVYCYQYMFYSCTTLTTAPVLPATILNDSCYQSMFQGCTNLTTAPELPATTLKTECYRNMFFGCTSLATAPELPATTLADSCYRNMFNTCKSLTKVPELPATTLASYCYNSMFQGCSNLTQAPALPATTLADNCYRNMFGYCTGLTKVPELPATTLVVNCYYSMLQGCTSLNYIKCLATDISASNCTRSWVAGVSSSGTFVRVSSTNWPGGTYGIPVGWTVEDV